MDRPWFEIQYCYAGHLPQLMQHFTRSGGLSAIKLSKKLQPSNLRLVQGWWARPVLRTIASLWSVEGGRRSIISAAAEITLAPRNVACP